MRILNNSQWGLRITLIGPDGTVYDNDAISNEPLRAAQILYDYKRVDPKTGGDMTVNQPVVTVARQSLPVIPLNGEKWIIKMPLDPDQSVDAPLVDFVFTQTRAVEGGRSIGFIRFYPTRAVNNEGT
jgi:hypothetical protein